MSCAVLQAPPGIFEYIDSESVSDEAGFVDELFYATCQNLRSAISLAYTREACIEQLLQVSRQAHEDGWDGHNGSAVQDVTLMNAYALIDALPTTVSIPEVSIDADGEVSFDWFAAPRRQFSISVGPKNNLSYAGLFGSDKVAGSERFDGVIPRTLLFFVNRVGALQ